MKPAQIVVLAGIAFVAILTLTIIGGSFYTVDQGERAVILRNGAFQSTAEPGLSFKLPMIDKAVFVSVQNQTQEYPKVQSYSRDQQPADLALSVSYHVKPDQVAALYGEYGSVENFVSRVLDRKTLEQVKNVFGQFNAVTAIHERARLNLEVQEAVQKAVAGPVTIDSVQIENIDFSDAYEQSIENRMLAEVEVQKIRQNAEREKVQAQITVTQAQAAADSQLAEATAAAKAVRLKGEADAAAIKARGDAEADVIKAKGAALHDNPDLIDLTKAEKWNGTLPTTMMPGTAVPFVNIK